MKTCLFIILALWAIGTTTLEIPDSKIGSVKGKYCGSHLADVLSIVCDGVYNNKQKKSMFTNDVNADDYNDVEPYQYSEGSVLSFPFRTREQAKSIIPLEFRKRSRGIVNECCLNACSLMEMSGYCGKQ